MESKELTPEERRMIEGVTSRLRTPYNLSQFHLEKLILKTFANNHDDGEDLDKWAHALINVANGIRLHRIDLLEKEITQLRDDLRIKNAISPDPDDDEANERYFEQNYKG